MKAFVTNCVGAIGEDINDMTDVSTQITRKTFLKHIDKQELKSIEEKLGYMSHYKQGLTMSRDYHVSYWKSKYQDKPCVYFAHSCIEYIFIEFAEQRYPFNPWS